MKIYITDKNEIRKVSLRTWDGKDWSPDFFGDLADDLPRFHCPSDLDDDADTAMTSAEYRELVEWWEEEVRAFNDREPSWFTEGLSDDDQERAWDKTEYGFFFD